MRQVDLSECEREPIHIPGAIQPFGALVALNEANFTVVQASANLAELMGEEGPWLGRNLADEFDEPSLLRLRQALSVEPLSEVNALALHTRGGAKGGLRGLEGVLHRSGGLLVLEIEPTPEPGSPYGVEPTSQSLRTAMGRLLSRSRRHELYAASTEAVRGLTGFDRVLLYQFHEDGHGEVVAESKNEALESLLGYHYPASDIPAQARELYLRNWIRFIPDVAYASVPIVPFENPMTGAPLDLSLSVLRSVSPVHVEYLTNMGVKASMSISLVVEGRLWGLLACHHAEGPHYVSYGVRRAAELLGQQFSWQLASLAALDASDYRSTCRAASARILRAAASKQGLAEGLIGAPSDLLGIVDASGAAIVYAGEIERVGIVPEEGDLLAISAHARARMNEGIYATESLAREMVGAEVLADRAAGVLALSLGEDAGDLVLWFRPERLRTVRWAGNPGKVLERHEGSARISPRQSFATWAETVRFCSTPFEPRVIEQAGELRSCILALCALRGREFRQLNFELGRALRTRDEFLSIAAHEMRTPLTTLSLEVDLLLRRVNSNPVLDASVRTGLDRLRRQLARLGLLVEGLLDVSRMQTEGLALHPEPNTNLSQIVHEAVGRLTAQAVAARSPIHLQVQEAVVGNWDPLRLDHVVTNLLLNAIKYGAHNPIEVGLSANDKEATLVVRDEGIGIPKEALSRIFGRFERAVLSQHYSGFGLGLWIVAAIVRASGGTVKVASETGKGSTFTVVLPLHREAPRR